MTDLQVYPNPTNGVFKLKTGRMKDQALQVSLMDISGKNIMNRLCEGADEYTFDISHGPKGYYFLRINSENTTQVRRIILTD